VSGRALRGGAGARYKRIMPDLRIQPATLEDLPLLAELLGDLFSQETDFHPDMDKQMRGLRLILEQPNRGRIFVLRNNLRIIGMINLLFTISTAEGGFVVLLEDLVVHADHRGQGHGSRLLEHAIGFAREKNFLRLTLLTQRGDGRLVEFYRKHGFVESEMVTMRRLLEPGGGAGL
jgi:GNAT superfamily N-acetyltransferase